MHFKQNQKTVHIAGDIHGTLAAVYGKVYKPYTTKLFPAIVNATRYLKTVLNIRGHEKIILKPIRGATTGLHFSSGNIFVDPRNTITNVVETIAHELVHAEQYNMGRLANSTSAYRLWNGTAYQPPRNYNEYRNLPWEKEAFDRQGELAAKALRGLI